MVDRYRYRSLPSPSPIEKPSSVLRFNPTRGTACAKAFRYLGNYIGVSLVHYGPYLRLICLQGPVAPCFQHNRILVMTKDLDHLRLGENFTYQYIINSDIDVQLGNGRATVHDFRQDVWHHRTYFPHWIALQRQILKFWTKSTQRPDCD